MQLSHMSDRPLDLKTQMQDLTRNTTDILLLEIPMIDNSNELYFDVIDNYRIHGVPEHAETEFLRYGIDHLMKLVKDAQPSD